jgi:hypothetical protein
MFLEYLQMAGVSQIRATPSIDKKSSGPKARDGEGLKMRIEDSA